MRCMLAWKCMICDPHGSAVRSESVCVSAPGSARFLRVSTNTKGASPEWLLDQLERIAAVDTADKTPQ